MRAVIKTNQRQFPLGALKSSGSIKLCAAAYPNNAMIWRICSCFCLGLELCLFLFVCLGLEFVCPRFGKLFCLVFQVIVVVSMSSEPDQESGCLGVWCCCWQREFSVFFLCFFFCVFCFQWFFFSGFFLVVVFSKQEIFFANFLLMFLFIVWQDCLT